MSTSLHLELTDDQIQRLDRAASKEQLSRSEATEFLLERALRIYEFPYVEFRDFGIGLEAFVRGSRLRVWWITTLVRTYGGDIAKAAKHVNLSEQKIRGALDYADAYPDEIAAAIAAGDLSYADLKLILPNLQLFTVDMKADAATP